MKINLLRYYVFGISTMIWLFLTIGGENLTKNQVLLFMMSNLLTMGMSDIMYVSV
jgi:hypothetical protein